MNGHGLNHAEFLELLLQDELAVRSDRLLKRRIKAAAFRELKTRGFLQAHVQGVEQPREPELLEGIA
jgi:hypothetical protein